MPGPTKKRLDSETVGDVTVDLFATSTDGTGDTLTYVVYVRKGGKIIESHEEKHRSVAQRKMDVIVTGLFRGRY